MEHDVEADAERQDEGSIPAEEEGERSEDLGCRWTQIIKLEDFKGSVV